MNVGFGDLVKFIEIAGKTYKYGFSRSQSAPTLYNEFGENIKHLGSNLEDLRKIISTVNQNGAAGGADLSTDTLAGLLGDYGRAIEDCEQLLKNKKYFSVHGGFVRNITWNFTIASDVQSLKDRIAVLNIKLLTVLKTLDLRLANQLHIDVFRIHRDLAARIDSARDDIIQQFQSLRKDIFHFLTEGANVDLPSSSTASTSLFDIPETLEKMFEQRLEEAGFDMRLGQFPLVEGLDAVVFHINTASTIVSDKEESKQERQWLEIAKAFSIIGHVKRGDEYRAACHPRDMNSFERQMNDMGVSVASYVRGLEIELLEILKDSKLSLITPDENKIIRTCMENPKMGPGHEDDNTGPTPTWELEFSEKIMSASLKGPYRDYNQSIELFRLTEVDLKLVITDTPKANILGREKTNNIMNVDMRRSRYIPLYASTNSPGGAFTITFQGDRLASGSSALVFTKQTELFKFQHAVTGYQVVLESIGIDAITYSSARVFGGNKSVYSGRVQLWRAKRPQNSTATEGSSISSPSSSSSNVTVMPAARPPNSPTMSSIASGSPGRDSMLSSVFSNNRRDSVMTTMSTATTNSMISKAGARSSVSVATTMLATSPTRYTTSVVDRDGNVGLVLEKPLPSVVMLYLQQESKKNEKALSFLGVEIDENTDITPSACNCRKDPQKCMRVVIQRSGSGVSTLTSFRHDAGFDLEQWNLASMGQSQRKSLPDSKERLSWVAVDFPTLGDKENFEQTFRKLRILYVAQLRAHREALRKLRNA
ncbi:hypothetical protein BGZ60DRAFT_406020 [Tricladium varicosporioides]|nr:hypothetical protein BGZ60DRAFT_406020 [Hymenoscyphus varicosporioides]